MSDRLKELLHQRALAQEQLSWLEREIARETGGQAASLAAPDRLAGRAETSRPDSAAAARAAENILIQYQRRPGQSVRDEDKRGCLIYFFAAFAVLILGIAALWFFKYRQGNLD